LPRAFTLIVALHGTIVNGANGGGGA